MTPDQSRLLSALDATWPAASTQNQGPWLIRQGNGGGQRVSAASALTEVTPNEITIAELAMSNLAQERIFQICPERDHALDQILNDQGYVVRDPVVFYVGSTAELATQSATPVVQAWPALAMSEQIWQDGGIGPGRWAVMDRAGGPKTTLLARKNDKPAGAAFVAIDGDIAMIHAIEVPAKARRQGAATDMLRNAALWANDHGAGNLALAVTRANVAANALYASLGMARVGGYHYRVKP